MGGDMSERMVHCVKLDQLLPGLDKQPFPGEIGEKIYEKVSAQAWKIWNDDIQIKVLNEYRLNMGDKRDYQFLVDQMLAFLNLQDGSVAEVENEKRGREG